MLRLNVLILWHQRCYRNQILVQDSPELVAEIVEGVGSGKSLKKIDYLLLLDVVEEFCEC